MQQLSAEDCTLQKKPFVAHFLGTSHVKSYENWFMRFRVIQRTKRVMLFEKQCTYNTKYLGRILIKANKSSIPCLDKKLSCC